MSNSNPFEDFWRDMKLEEQLEGADKETVFFYGAHYLMNLLDVLETLPTDSKVKIYQDFFAHAKKLKDAHEKQRGIS